MPKLETSFYSINNSVNKNIMNKFIIYISVYTLIIFLLLNEKIEAQDKRKNDSKDEKAPNIIILLADDLGYGDLGVYGHPTIHTPNLDRLAANGMKFTQFYAGAPVCSPSRAALLTGRLPVRSGMASSKEPIVFVPHSDGGLQSEEITIAEALKTQNYSTACIGKWHLGHSKPEYLPTRQGFDYFFGIPYSGSASPQENDFGIGAQGFPQMPLFQNEKIIEQPVDESTLTSRFTDETINFIKENKKNPFFIYLAYNYPHVKLHASERFSGKSSHGLYGDVVEEIDWSVGEIIKTLKELGIEENTFVFFTSDNGPWKTQELEGGSTGELRGEKGSTWEGGMRVPAIAYWPTRIEGGKTTQALGTVMDLFNTSLSLANVPIPNDRVIDGVDLSPVLFGEKKEVREEIFYYRGTELFAVRLGEWKAHFAIQEGYGEDVPRHLSRPLLYNLNWDPAEQYNFNITKEYNEIMQKILPVAYKQVKSVVQVKNQLNIFTNVDWTKQYK